MTITSRQTVLPARAFSSADKNATKPPPKVFPVPEPPFKGYHPPQPDGYQQSKASPSSSAIVIDNGRFICYGTLYGLLHLAELSRRTYRQGRMVFREKSPIHHPPRDEPLPRPQAEQGVSICGIRCLCGRYDSRSNAIRIRSRYKHCG